MTIRDNFETSNIEELLGLQELGADVVDDPFDEEATEEVIVDVKGNKQGSGSVVKNVS